MDRVKSWVRGHVGTVVAVAVALAVGMAVGGGDTAGKATPGKPPAVEQEGPSQACVTLINHYEDLRGQFQEFVGVAGDNSDAASAGFFAAAVGDVAGLEAATARVDANTARIVELTGPLGVTLAAIDGLRDGCLTP